jgi:hypothetical protein
MSDIKPLHRPKWQPVEGDWHMIVGNQSVAVLIPNSCSIQPWANWISRILIDCPSHGWDNVDFDTLANGQEALEQWWSCMCLGEAFRG